MAEPALRFAAAAGLGLGIGLFFYGTLWLTVRGLHERVHPQLTILASFLGRTAVVLLAFYLLAGKGFSMVLPAAVGFLFSRALLVRHLAPERRSAVERATR